MGGCWASSSRPEGTIEQERLDIDNMNRSGNTNEIRDLSMTSRKYYKMRHSIQQSSPRFWQNENTFNDKDSESEYSPTKHGVLSKKELVDKIMNL